MEEISIITDEKILRQVSEPVTHEEFEAGLVEEVVEKLKKALPTAWANGVGLAAIQIGIPKRISYIGIGEFKLTLVNPVIKEHHGSIIVKEGCLSIPHIWTRLVRSTRLKCLSERKPGVTHEHLAEGVLAQVIQHEIDHMDGILNIDKEYQEEVEKRVKIGRNALCPCGSGTKYKRCCLN